MTRAFEAMRTGGDEDSHLHIEGRTITARRRGGQHGLVRFRRPVRRAALAARLPRDRPPVRRGDGVRHPPDGAPIPPIRRAASPGSWTSCTIIA
jgi:hypothetical protein